MFAGFFSIFWEAYAHSCSLAVRLNSGNSKKETGNKFLSWQTGQSFSNRNLPLLFIWGRGGEINSKKYPKEGVSVFRTPF